MQSKEIICLYLFKNKNINSNIWKGKGKKRYTEQLRKKTRKWWEGSKNKINVDIFFLKLQKDKKKRFSKTDKK